MSLCSWPQWRLFPLRPHSYFRHRPRPSYRHRPRCHYHHYHHPPHPPHRRRPRRPRFLLLPPPPPPPPPPRCRRIYSPLHLSPQSPLTTIFLSLLLRPVSFLSHCLYLQLGRASDCILLHVDICKSSLRAYASSRYLALLLLVQAARNADAGDLVPTVTLHANLAENNKT